MQEPGFFATETVADWRPGGCWCQWANFIWPAQCIHFFLECEFFQRGLHSYVVKVSPDLMSSCVLLLQPNFCLISQHHFCCLQPKDLHLMLILKAWRDTEREIEEKIMCPDHTGRKLVLQVNSATCWSWRSLKNHACVCLPTTQIFSSSLSTSSAVSPVSTVTASEPSSPGHLQKHALFGRCCEGMNYLISDEFT